MGPQLKVSPDRLVKPGIEPATPGLQGKRFIHYTTAAPTFGIIRAVQFDSNQNIKMYNNACLIHIPKKRVCNT